MNNNLEVKYISVTALNRYISYKFEMDVNLKEVYLKGEISNFKYSGKHCYFSLKDQNSELSAMFFYPDNLNLDFKPSDGMSVLVKGVVQVYQKKGTYAIIVKTMKQEGIGLLYQQFLELKDKLYKEGLFDESRKLPIPEYPERVAIITAPTGEAINDIVSTFNRRLPLAKLKLYPALVQGKDAPKDLIRAIYEVIKDNWAEVLIIGRGGGSYEDLACFNDEGLVRLLASLKFPVVSAVGHEGDYTICDFVASYRAPTPTGAAMRLTKDKMQVMDSLYDKMTRLNEGIKNILIHKFNQLSQCSNAYVLSHFDEYLNTLTHPYVVLSEKLSTYKPERILKNWEDAVLNLSSRLDLGFNYNTSLIEKKYNDVCNKFTPNLLMNYINNLENNVMSLIDKAVLLNPFNIMLKGYALPYQEEHLVKSIDELDLTKNLRIVLHDGEVLTKPIEIVKKEEENNGR